MNQFDPTKWPSGTAVLYREDDGKLWPVLTQGRPFKIYDGNGSYKWMVGIEDSGPSKFGYNGSYLLSRMTFEPRSGPVQPVNDYDPDRPTSISIHLTPSQRRRIHEAGYTAGDCAIGDWLVRAATRLAEIDRQSGRVTFTAEQPSQLVDAGLDPSCDDIAERLVVSTVQLADLRNNTWEPRS